MVRSVPVSTVVIISAVGLAYAPPWPLDAVQRSVACAVLLFAWMAIVYRPMSLRRPMVTFVAPAPSQPVPAPSFVAPAPMMSPARGGSGEGINFKRWANECNRAISDLIVNAGIHCQYSMIRGPFSLTYDLDMVADEVAGLNKIKTLAPALLAKLHSPVRIALDTQRGLLLEVGLPKELTQTPNAFDLARLSQWPELPVGIDAFNQVVTVNPAQHGAIFWIAPPQRGKTASMRSTLALARLYLPDMRFVIMAMPAKLRENWGAFDGIDGCLGLVGDFAEMQQALEWVVKEMHRRRSETPTFIVLDDVANLAANLPKAGALLKELALAGPGLGYHLLGGTHSAGSMAAIGGDSLIQSAMTCKVMFKASGSSQGARGADMKNEVTGLDQLSGAPGDGVLLLNGTPTRLATCQIRDDQILKLTLAQHDTPSPWKAPPAVPTAPTPVSQGFPVEFVVAEPAPANAADLHEQRLGISRRYGFPVTEGQFGETHSGAVRAMWNTNLFDSPRQLTSYVFGCGEPKAVNGRRRGKIVDILPMTNEVQHVQ